MTIEQSVSQAAAYRGAAQHHRDQAAHFRALASQHPNRDPRTPIVLTIAAGHESQAESLERSAESCERRAIVPSAGYLVGAA